MGLIENTAQTSASHSKNRQGEVNNSWIHKIEHLMNSCGDDVTLSFAQCNINDDNSQYTQAIVTQIFDNMWRFPSNGIHIWLRRTKITKSCAKMNGHPVIHGTQNVSHVTIIASSPVSPRSKWSFFEPPNHPSHAMRYIIFSKHFQWTEITTFLTGKRTASWFASISFVSSLPRWPPGQTCRPYLYTQWTQSQHKIRTPNTPGSN